MARLDRLHQAADRVRLAIHDHPRHLVLGASVAGLLLAPLGPIAVLPATLIAAALGRRSVIALLAGAAVLGGAAFAGARLVALDGGVLAHMHGRTITSHAVLLAPPPDRGFGPAAARTRRLDGPAGGPPAGPPPPAGPGPGAR